MSVSPARRPSDTAIPTRQGRKLAVVLLGLTSLIVTMLGAYALPAVNSGPQDIPIGLTGQQTAASTLEKTLADGTWTVSRYESEQALTTAIKKRKVMGGLALSRQAITVYTATAAGPTSAASLTAAASKLAAQKRIDLAIDDLAPFPENDTRGAGFSAALLPLILSGVIPTIALTRLFPGHSHLRLRLIGGLIFALSTGFAVTAILQYATGSLAGDYWLTSLGVALGIAALAITLLGLEAMLGLAGVGLGAGVLLLVANPLSGFTSGPHWLPDGWAAFGQVLPPGASGSLLRANAFFDGTGAWEPTLVLTGWVGLGLALILIADQTGTHSSAKLSPLAVP